MRFLLHLSLWEARSSWKKLFFFFLCIALGVASVVALRSLISNLGRAVGSDARQLMTADVEINSTNPFTPSEISEIEQTAARSGIVDGRDEFYTAAAMARPVDPANDHFKFVELKGINDTFPLVGTFQMSDGTPFDFKLLSDQGAVVAEILLEDLAIKVGDKIRIGESEFTIKAAFDDEPGGTNGFRLGPRVFISQAGMEQAGILRNSGRIRRRILFRTTSEPNPLVSDLRISLKNDNVQVRSYKESQDRLSEQFARSENYLSLTGLLILVLGGIGVFNVARAFVEQKKKTVAILKCLGAKGSLVIAAYLIQILILGAAGSLLGALLAQLALLTAKVYFNADLPVAMSYSITSTATLQGTILGILISLIFSALPLLQIRGIKPRLVLRDENNAKLKLEAFNLIIAIGSVAALLVLAVWQAGSFRIGAAFLIGLSVAAGCLYLAAALLTRLLKRSRPFGAFAFSQAVNSIHRPGNQSRLILLAVGLGCFVVLTVLFIQANLLREFDFTRNNRLPTLFFVDVQKSQIDELAKGIFTVTGEKPETTPIVRSKISAVNGKPFDQRDRKVKQRQGQIGREFAITFRPKLDENEKVVDGAWWSTDASPEPQVSVEEEMARRLGVHPGDSITFDISGRKVTARVENIRTIDLRNTRTAFVFVFRPGALDKAPRTYAATTLSRISATDRQRLTRNIIDRFPNVQVFDVADILAAVKGLLNNIVLAVTFVGAFVMLSGILILIGSITLTKAQRTYENAILKTLGADRRTLSLILLTEYGLLGAIAGCIGISAAAILSWVVCRFLMDVSWQFDPGVALIGFAAEILIVIAVGLIASFDVLFRKPLPTLRQH